MPDYLVTWLITIEADSHLEAAQAALEIQRDPESTSTNFVVTAPGLPGALIDLSPEEGDPVVTYAEPGVPSALERYSEATLDKARRAVARHEIWRDKDSDQVWWARSASGGPLPGNYRLQVIGDGRWITCTCSNGAVHGGEPTCWHSAAVLTVVGDL